MKTFLIYFLSALAAFGATTNFVTIENLPSSIGAGGNDYIVLYYNTGSGFQAQKLSARGLQNLPNTAFILTNNFFVYRGAVYGPFADQTLTISNAWKQFALAPNSWAPGGDTTYIMPGIHQIGDFPLTWPPSGYIWGNTMTICGAGMTASVLLNTNLVPNDALHIATTPATNSTVFNMHDVCLACWTNALGTNLLSLGSVAATPSNGGLAGGDIENCLFTCWSLHNASWPVFTPDVFSGPGCGLIAINLQNGYGDMVRIQHNWFDFVAGNFLQNDHFEIEGNVFEGCNPSGFSTGSLFSLGFPNVLSGQGGTFHGAWSIGHNEFVSGSSEGMGYLFAAGTAVPETIYGDDYEAAAGTPIVGTIKQPIALVDCFANGNVQGMSYFTTPFWVVRGAPPYSMIQDFTLVQIGDWNQGLGQYRASLTNQFNIFGGTFNGYYTGNVTSGNVFNVSTNYNQIVLFTNLPNQTLPPNSIATYTFFYTNTVNDYAVYTNNLAISTNAFVFAGTGCPYSFIAPGWNFVPTNEISSGGVSFNFAPSSGLSLSGNWIDFDSIYLAGVFDATNQSTWTPAFASLLAGTFTNNVSVPQTLFANFVISSNPIASAFPSGNLGIAPTFGVLSGANGMTNNSNDDFILNISASGACIITNPVSKTEILPNLPFSNVPIVLHPNDQIRCSGGGFSASQLYPL